MNKMILLGEILTDVQIEAVIDIIESNPDPFQRVNKLKTYLNQFKDELEQKGVVADYLAYLLEYLLLAGKQNLERN